MSTREPIPASPASRADAVRPLADLDPAELEAFLAARRADHDALREQGLTLDLTRGKPSPEQLELSTRMLRLPTGTHDRDGVDVRNYGGLEGLLELREIFADLLGTDVANVLCQGNSSLTLMHQVLVDLLLFGGPGSPRPWRDEPVVRFVCPVPGYDRHFAMLAEFGIEMLPVPMTDEGPDVDAVRALVADDPSVKGLWLVPTYANPTGAVCSLEVATALMSMPTAAPDFRIFWDDAYAVHHLTDHEVKTPDPLSLAAANGHPDRPVVFASTSKITFAGAGVAVLALSPANKAWYLAHLALSSIGPDKVNQLRHVEFFESAEGLRSHMRRHRAVLAPKFAAVQLALASGLADLGVARWSEPTGGYFVDLDVLPGTATRVVELAAEAGIALTPAGASYPHGVDPEDHNIRLAPTFPALPQVQTAMAGVATCVALAAAEALVARGNA